MKCERCTGLFIPVWFVGGDDELGAWEYPGWKCLNCGHVADPLLIKNRQLLAQNEAAQQSVLSRIAKAGLGTLSAA
jgi:hypothetical protein